MLARAKNRKKTGKNRHQFDYAGPFPTDGPRLVSPSSLPPFLGEVFEPRPSQNGSFRPSARPLPVSICPTRTTSKFLLAAFRKNPYLYSHNKRSSLQRLENRSRSFVLVIASNSSLNFSSRSQKRNTAISRGESAIEDGSFASRKHLAPLNQSNLKLNFQEYLRRSSVSSPTYTRFCSGSPLAWLPLDPLAHLHPRPKNRSRNQSLP